jgi:hypothetical protein
MTAIYAVWNNYGFALASDSNQTATQTDQTWVDPVEKIILLHNHQVAVAAAGSAMHEDIEINEIIRSWESQLPTAGFQKLDDYFIDFSLWFAGQNGTPCRFCGDGASSCWLFTLLSSVLDPPP